MKRYHRGYVVGFAALGILLAAAMVFLARTDLGTPGSVVQTPAERTGTANVRILGANDLHGNLEPPIADVGDEPDVGGVAYLDAHMDRHERIGRTVRVHSGDMVGGSPLVSSHFHDEPTILAMNEMGFDVGTLGNHEFDEGGREMMRLLDGGKRTDDGDSSGGSATSSLLFPGAGFPYVSANTLRAGPGVGSAEPPLPPHVVLERDGVRIGLIGVTTPTTLGGLAAEDETPPFRFEDMSVAVDRSVEDLRARGVETIIVLAHAGGEEIAGEAAQMSGAVDLVMAAHTHAVMNQRVDGKLVVEAGEYAQAFSLVDLRIDRRTGDVVEARAEVLPTDHRGIQPDEPLAGLTARYAEGTAHISERLVAEVAAGVSRRSNASGESALGDLVADAQRSEAGTDVAFVNPAGLRADLRSGPVTFGELSTIQPFSDGVVRMELSGDALLRLLEQQHNPLVSDHPLQVSGLRYTVDASRPAGSRVTAVTMQDGSSLQLQRTYTVAADDFLAAGADALPAFREGTNRRVVGEDVDLLASYLGGMQQPIVGPDPERERRISAIGR